MTKIITIPFKDMYPYYDELNKLITRKENEPVSISATAIDRFIGWGIIEKITDKNQLEEINIVNNYKNYQKERELSRFITLISNEEWSYNILLRVNQVKKRNRKKIEHKLEYYNELKEQMIIYKSDVKEFNDKINRRKENFKEVIELKQQQYVISKGLEETIFALKRFSKEDKLHIQLQYTSIIASFEMYIESNEITNIPKYIKKAVKKAIELKDTCNNKKQQHTRTHEFEEGKIVLQKNSKREKDPLFIKKIMGNFSNIGKIYLTCPFEYSKDCHLQGNIKFPEHIQLKKPQPIKMSNLLSLYEIIKKVDEHINKETFIDPMKHLYRQF